VLIEPRVINDLPETQSRVKLDSATIADYAAKMSDGVEFPAIELYFDGKDYYLVDGFHRFAAHMTAFGQDKPINADVIPGSLRDAILCSVSVNSTHGLPRSNADKRRAVSVLLADEEWGRWSSREIARRCSVSDVFVEKVRKEFLVPNEIEARVYNQQGHLKTIVIDRTEAAKDCTLSVGVASEPPPPETIVATYQPKEAPEVEAVEAEFEIQILRTGVKISDGWDSALVAWENVPETIEFFKTHEQELLKKCENL
jgi:hypothetical protein